MKTKTRKIIKYAAFSLAALMLLGIAYYYMYLFYRLHHSSIIKIVPNWILFHAWALPILCLIPVIIKWKSKFYKIILLLAWLPMFVVSTYVTAITVPFLLKTPSSAEFAEKIINDSIPNGFELVFERFYPDELWSTTSGSRFDELAHMKYRNYYWKHPLSNPYRIALHEFINNPEKYDIMSKRAIASGKGPPDKYRREILLDFYKELSEFGADASFALPDLEQQLKQEKDDEVKQALKQAIESIKNNKSIFKKAQERSFLGLY